MLTPPPSPPPCAAQVRHEMFGTGVDENAGVAEPQHDMAARAQQRGATHAHKVIWPQAPDNTQASWHKRLVYYYMFAKDECLDDC